MKFFLSFFLIVFGSVVLLSTGAKEKYIETNGPSDEKKNSFISRTNSGSEIQEGLQENSLKNQTLEEISLSREGAAKVKRIIDGDTIEVEIDGSTEKVRLIGINTPERDQPYFENAKNKLSELIGNKEVKLEKDISETDKYGRLLRYIYLDDLFVNLEMIKSGFAQSSTYQPDVKFQNLFRAAEAEARQQQIGFWSPDLPKLATYEVANNKVENSAPNPECPIKGNISSGGKIYHTPDGEYYKKTKIDEENGERWFCSEVEAQKAGWRKSKK